MKAFIRKHISALRLCLSLSIMAVLALTPCMTGKAVDASAGFVGQRIGKNAPFSFDVLMNDSILLDSGSTRNTYYYSTHVSGSFDVSFYNNATITPFDTTTVNYHFKAEIPPYSTHSGFKVSNLQLSLSLIIAGIEYPIPNDESNFLIVASAFPKASHVVVRCHYAMDLSREFTEYAMDFGELKHFDVSIPFYVTARQFDMYNQPDMLSTMNQNVLSLMQNGAGIQGAIEHQTWQQQQDALKEQQLQQQQNQLQEHGNQLQQEQNNLTHQQTQQQHEDANNIMNGYDSTAGNSSLGNFNEGIGKYEDAQSAITDSAYDNLDKFTIPGGGIGNMVAGLTASVPIASTMLQAIFQSSGDFTIIMTVTLILTITCMLLGIAKYYMR